MRSAPCLFQKKICSTHSTDVVTQQAKKRTESNCLAAVPIGPGSCPRTAQGDPHLFICLPAQWHDDTMYHCAQKNATWTRRRQETVASWALCTWRMLLEKFRSSNPEQVTMIPSPYNGRSANLPGFNSKFQHYSSGKWRGSNSNPRLSDSVALSVLWCYREDPSWWSFLPSLLPKKKRLAAKSRCAFHPRYWDSL